MSYQILYDPQLTYKYQSKMKKQAFIRWATVIMVIVVVVTFIISAKEQIYPHDLEQTNMAFSEMVDDLKAGERMIEAFSDFCVKVIGIETDI